MSSTSVEDTISVLEESVEGEFVFENNTEEGFDEQDYSRGFLD